MNTAIETIRGLLKIQGENGNWNCNDYMRGMYNGMECVLATLEQREPVYRNKPQGGWLDDVSSGSAPLTSSCDEDEDRHKKIVSRDTGMPVAVAITDKSIRTVFWNGSVCDIIPCGSKDYNMFSLTLPVMDV